MNNRLVPDMPVMAKGSLSDEYIAIAFNIEQALIACGAEAGKDYQILDLFKLAQPFAVEMCKEAKINEILYPSSQVI